MSTKKKWLVGLVVVSLLPMSLAFVMLATIVGLIGEYNNTIGRACAPAVNGLPVTYTGPAVGSLTPMQMSRAAAVVQAGREVGIPDRGIVVALATASQESGFKVYANDGKGNDLKPDQQGIEASMNLPHDAVGTDHGSIGVFQQQWPWWGTMPELMDPATSARKFYGALAKIEGWESLPVTVAAQRVQRSAYPDAYADDEPLAEQLLATIDENGSSDAGAKPIRGGRGGSASGTNASSGDRYNLGPVTPQLRAVVEELAPKFGIRTVGGYRQSARDPHGHPAGLAADFMTTGGSRHSRPDGDGLAKYAAEHALELGIDYIIWKQRIWSASRANEGWQPMEDRGSPTLNHEDHVHINVLPGAASPLANSEPAEVVNGIYRGGTATCVMPATMTSQVVFPLPQGSGYVDQHNFGQTGGRWTNMHTGNDYSVACGTPVYAVTSGTVQFDKSHESWAGHTFMKISTGPGQLATWYAHMETRTVQEGQQVQAGQKIGTVGNLGNSSGCHLHFEVHPSGGGIYDDPVDPVAWFASHLGGGTGLTLASTAGAVQLGTLNVLGSSHTDGNPPKRPGWRPSKVRIRDAANLLERRGLDVVGMQEFQPPQVKEFNRVTGNTWARYGNRDNAVIWRKSRFKLDSSRTVGIPYFRGKTRQMPVVRLRDSTTGTTFTVINVHNPADAHGPAAKWRRQAERIERQLVRAEAAAGNPVLLVGDFNDRKKTFCSITAQGILLSASGGTNDATGCKPPAGRMSVDWIFGSGVLFSDYQVDPSPRRQKISDHPLVVASVKLGTAATPPSGNGQLTVLTYNIHHGTGGLEAIAQEIANSGAAVVALQEADNRGSGDFGHHVQWLASRLGMQYAYAVNGRWKGKDMIDNAILSKFPIVETDNERLPGGDGIHPRGLLRASIAVAGQVVDVYGTHLHDAGAARLEQAREVADEVGRASCPTVVMGDLSFTPNRKMYQVVTRSLRDAFAGRAGGKTSPNRDPRVRIDYVLHDKAARVEDAQVMPAGVSDHRAVRVTLRFDPEESC